MRAKTESSGERPTKELSQTASCRESATASAIAARYNRSMTMTVLTCVSCGKTLLVRDEPDEKRDKRCTCNQSMVEKRRPGSVL